MIGCESQEHHQDFGFFPGIDSNVSYPSQQQQAFDYRHCNYVVYPSSSSVATTGGEMKGAKGEDSSFPVRLHYLLDVLQQDGLAHLASWQPHGRCFVVHNPDEFSEKVLPLWFRQSRFGSFQRQLNLYGFKRLKQGRDKGGYYHESFLRGYPQLAHEIKRAKTKKSKQSDSDEELGEPNFYSIPFLPMTYPAAILRTVHAPPPASLPAPPAAKENVFSVQPQLPAGQAVAHSSWAAHVPAPNGNAYFDAEDMPVLTAPGQGEDKPSSQHAPVPVPAPYKDSFLDLNVPLLQTKLFASPQPPASTPCLHVASKAQDIPENVNKLTETTPPCDNSTSTSTSM